MAALANTNHKKEVKLAASLTIYSLSACVRVVKVVNHNQPGCVYVFTSKVFVKFVK